MTAGIISRDGLTSRQRSGYNESMTNHTTTTATTATTAPLRGEADPNGLALYDGGLYCCDDCGRYFPASDIHVTEEDGEFCYADTGNGCREARVGIDFDDNGRSLR